MRGNDFDRNHEVRWHQINLRRAENQERQEHIKCSKSVSLGNRAD